MNLDPILCDWDQRSEKVVPVRYETLVLNLCDECRDALNLSALFGILSTAD